MCLSENQVNFIVNHFFRGASKHAGAVNIGIKLLTKDSVVVAGNDPIFIGGIGNYISVKKAENFVDCLEYKFDIALFLSSPMFIERYEDELLKLEVEMALIKSKIDDLKKFKEL